MDREVDLHIRTRQGREMPRHVRCGEQRCLEVIGHMTQGRFESGRRRCHPASIP